MVSRASATPSAIVELTLAAYSATPALSSTMSRAGPGSSSSTERSSAFEASAESTRKARLLAMVNPKSSGWISYSRMPRRRLYSPTIVAAPSETSSMPSRP
jgi:hypothetical protein